ncbi:MAG: hypothetical protein KDD45_10520 [Bdellovibrionales bacterium]|nr:hypothetical protein [Bdellovibrionales bacterium]
MRNKNLIGKLVLGFSLTFSLAYSTSEARGSNGDRGRASDRRDQRGGYDQRLETQQYAGRCIGGKKCGGSRNQLSIDLPTDVNVQRIEIFADDLVGSVHRGSLNVYLDGRLLGQALDVSPDSGKLFSFNVKSRNSAQLLVAANANDEVNVQWVKVYYSRENNGGHYDPGHGGGYYPGYGSSRLDFQGGCIGGEKCPGRLSELYLTDHNK